MHDWRSRGRHEIPTVFSTVIQFLHAFFNFGEQRQHSTPTMASTVDPSAPAAHSNSPDNLMDFVMMPKKA
jgi:hypothetical protein